MLVREILKAKGNEVITTTGEASLVELAELLHARHIGAALVVSGHNIVGVVSERDIVHAVATFAQEALELPVRDIMTEDVIFCSLDDPVDRVMATMTGRRVRHVPVVDGARLVGLISIGDVVKHRVGEIEAEASLLRDYVTAR